MVHLSRDVTKQGQTGEKETISGCEARSSGIVLFLPDSILHLQWLALHGFLFVFLT